MKTLKPLYFLIALLIISFTYISTTFGQIGDTKANLEKHLFGYKTIVLQDCIIQEDTINAELCILNFEFGLCTNIVIISSTTNSKMYQQYLFKTYTCPGWGFSTGIYFFKEYTIFKLVSDELLLSYLN